MHVAPPERAPIDEFDSELESRLATAHEVALIQAEERIEGPQRRDTGFAYADGTDLIRFDKLNARPGIGQRPG